MMPNLPPDWAKLSPDKADKVEEQRRFYAAQFRIDSANPGAAGLRMRAMMMAMADQYDNRSFEIGIESCTRGVANAFGERWMELNP